MFDKIGSVVKLKRVVRDHVHVQCVQCHPQRTGAPLALRSATTVHQVVHFNQEVKTNYTTVVIIIVVIVISTTAIVVVVISIINFHSGFCCC